MSVGVFSLDEDHKKIIAQINKLYDAIKRKTSAHVVRSVFCEFEHFADVHLEREEQLMRQTKFPGLKAHLAEHTEIRRALSEEFSRYREDADNFEPLDLLTLLCQWMTNHILHSDMMLKEHLNAHGIY